MPQVVVYSDSVPAAVVAQMVQVVANNNLKDFVSIATDLAWSIAPRLHAGAKMATGTCARGFHGIDITLRKRITRITNVGFRETVEIPDVPIYTRLTEVSRYMQVKSPDAALSRIIYWMYVAVQYLSMYLDIYIMDHQKEEWREHKFQPLIDARDVLVF